MAAVIHKLSIPSSSRFLSDVRQFIVTHLLGEGVPDSIVADVRLAVDEACANIIEHAYQDNPRHELRVELHIDKQRISVTISDSGIPFNEDEYQKPDVRVLTKRRKSGGLGVHIMRRLMDRVDYTVGADQNEICLIKYLHSSLSSN